MNSPETDPALFGRIVRERCVGALVDILTGLMIGVRTLERESMDANVRGFGGSLKALGIPHCVLGDEGGFRGEFFPVTRSDFAEAPHFGRHTPSAWRSGGFREWVLSHDRPQVVLGGLTLDNCTLLTALDMRAEGLDVHVVVDVSGAESPLVEQASMARLVGAGVILHNWASFACEAMADWQSPHGPEIGALLMRHSPFGAVGVPGAH